MSEIELRTFRNFDPPKLVRLWNTAYQSRGVAAPISNDIFDVAVISHIYFDPAGLIVATREDQIVGFVHVGFCVNEAHTGLDHSQAVICSLVIDPEQSFSELGSRLIDAARDYALKHDSNWLFAGASPERDPFYCGILGGTRPSGVMKSQEQLTELFEHSDFEPFESHGIFQKDLQTARPPVNFRLAAIRRKMEMRLTEEPRVNEWWTSARLSNFEILRFEMVPKDQIEPIAAVTLIGLDFFVSNWNHRAVGLLGFAVADGNKEAEYGQAILVEVGRRLKEEMVTMLEIHARLDRVELVNTIKEAGFSQVDTGVVYRLPLNAE